MKINLLYLLLLLPTLAFTQNFPITCGEPNKTNFGQIFAMPNGNILINNYIRDEPYATAYSKLLIIDSQGVMVSEKKFDYYIRDLEVYSTDSIYSLYYIFKEDTSYLYCDLFNSNYKIVNKDSIAILETRAFRTKLFFHNDSLMFFGNHFNFPPTNPHLTLGKINKNGTFSNYVKTIEIHSALVADALITSQNEWYIFCNLNYIVKLDSNYNLLDEHGFINDGANLTSDYNSFWVNDKYFITGGTTNDSQLKIVKSYDYFVRRKKITFEESHSGDRAGQFSNVAKADSFFYFVGTKGIDTTDVNYTIAGKTYVFVACLDFDLKVRWERKFGGDAYYEVYSLCTTKNNECLVLASKDTLVDDLPVNMLYVLKINPQGNIVTSAPVYKTQNSALIYPNPGINTLNIKLPEYTIGTTLNLYNISGVKVLSNKVNTNRFSISTSHLPKGVYIYEITDNKNQRIQGKWIKQ